VKEIDRRWLVPIAHRSASSQALAMLEAALRTVELPLAPGCECLFWGNPQRSLIA
jgi:hypothetical protein